MGKWANAAMIAKDRMNLLSICETDPFPFRAGTRELRQLFRSMEFVAQETEMILLAAGGRGFTCSTTRPYKMCHCSSLTLL